MKYLHKFRKLKYFIKLIIANIIKNNKVNNYTNKIIEKLS